MQDRDWLTLRRLVDSPEFVKPAGFDKSVTALLKKVVESTAKAISSQVDVKLFDLRWIQKVCADLNIKATGKTRAPYLKDALMRIYQQNKEDIFWNKVRRTRQGQIEVEQSRKERLEKFYDELCRTANQAVRLDKLRSYFVEDDKVDEKLKEFRSEFGVAAGARKTTKLETRLKAIAQELERRKASNGFN